MCAIGASEGQKKEEKKNQVEKNVSNIQENKSEERTEEKTTGEEKNKGISKGEKNGQTTQEEKSGAERKEEKNEGKKDGEILKVGGENVEEKNVEEKNVEEKNVEKNVEGKNVDKKNVEDNVDKKNVEEKNVEGQNVDKKNVEEKNLGKENGDNGSLRDSEELLIEEGMLNYHYLFANKTALAKSLERNLKSIENQAEGELAETETAKNAISFREEFAKKQKFYVPNCEQQPVCVSDSFLPSRSGHSHILYSETQGAVGLNRSGDSLPDLSKLVGNFRDSGFSEANITPRHKRDNTLRLIGISRTPKQARVLDEEEKEFVHRAMQQHIVLDEHFIENISPRLLFRYFPLVTAVIQEIANNMSNDLDSANFLNIFLSRINTNRALKTKFLLFVGNKEYAFWKVRLLHDLQCFTAIQEQTQPEEMAPEDSGEGEVVEGKGKEIEEKREKVLQESLRVVPQIVLRKSDDGIKKSECDGPDADTLDRSGSGYRKSTLVNLFVKMSDEFKLNTITFGSKIYNDTFTGTQAVDWLSKKLEIGREEAVEIGEKMIEQEIIEAVPGSTGFSDSNTYYSKSHENFDSLREKRKQMFALKNRGSWLITTDGKKLGLGSMMETMDLQQAIRKEMDTTNDDKSDKANTTENLIACVEVVLGVDSVDLQTLHCLRKTIFQEIKEKDEFGYTAIAHPFKYNKSEGVLINKLVCEKIFSSIAAPVMISLRTIPDLGFLDDEAPEVDPRIISKKGDNLFQDLCCQVVFRCLNVIWETTPDVFASKWDVPFIHTYEVFPTAENEGFMEVVNNVIPFKDFDWLSWEKQRTAIKVANMINSAAGAYIGGYILGVRDRHWDNILIQNNETLFHIDFGFLLGTAPPIDAPKFSISQSMKDCLKKIGKWDHFIKKCTDAFRALRLRADEVIRLVVLVFSQGGWDPEKVKQYLVEQSLMMGEDDDKVINLITAKLTSSAESWQNIFKQFSHKTIDPLWYGLLKKGVTPATATMKLVEKKAAKEQGKSKRIVSQEGKTLTLRSHSSNILSSDVRKTKQSKIKKTTQ